MIFYKVWRMKDFSFVHVQIKLADARKFTPLIMATYISQSEIAEMLIDNGARVDIKSRGMTPLSKAVALGQLKAAALTYIGPLN